MRTLLLAALAAVTLILMAGCSDNNSVLQPQPTGVICDATFTTNGEDGTLTVTIQNFSDMSIQPKVWIHVNPDTGNETVTCSWTGREDFVSQLTPSPSASDYVYLWSDDSSIIREGLTLPFIDPNQSYVKKVYYQKTSGLKLEVFDEQGGDENGWLIHVFNSGAETTDLTLRYRNGDILVDLPGQPGAYSARAEGVHPPLSEQTYMIRQANICYVDMSDELEGDGLLVRSFHTNEELQIHIIGTE